jgi:prolyl-tRNA editing enzyme YbaK/EbsC (Cys-tRNA(Pro) deacylase)
VTVQSVRKEFEERGLGIEIRQLDAGTETVERAARALGVEPARIAKTLAFRLKERVILVLARGDARVDNRKFKDCFGVKAKMLSPEELLAATGHPVGGVCPFGLREPLEIHLDRNLLGFETVFPAAGSGNSCFEIAPRELARLTLARWVDVCQ